jgi:predicted ester cyclase
LRTSDVMNQHRPMAVPEIAASGLSSSEMKDFVRRHFEDFVNRKDLGAALRNFSSDFLDHDGPAGPVVGPEAACQMMEGAYRHWPDLHVVVLDAICEGDKVVVRNRWTATDLVSGRKCEFHGFVMWRFARGKIVERWATLTEPEETT